jgi:hypothetical protein
MRFTPLTLEERAASTFTHRFDFSYADIPTGLATNTAQVFGAANAPAGWKGLPAFKASDVSVRQELHVSEKFQNTADTALNTTTVSFGDAGSATRFFSAVETNQNGTAVVDTIPGSAPNQVYTAPSQLQFTLNSMAGKSISNLNRGKLYILLELQRFAGPTEKAAPYGAGYT